MQAPRRKSSSKSFVLDDIRVEMRYSDDEHEGGGAAGALRLGGLEEAFQAGIEAASGSAKNGPVVKPSQPSSQGSRKGRVRRPDREPFVLQVPGSAFFPSRAMPQAGTKYAAVVGESFWKVAAYLDSVPSRLEERVEGARRSPHLLLRGVPGAGKSFLLASTAGLLAAASAAQARPALSINGDDYRCVLIGDCRRWLESEDPLQYFRLEVLAAFAADAAVEPGASVGDPHSAPGHAGCMVCVRPFTCVADAKALLERLCGWVRAHCPDTWLLVFLDQTEELLRGPADSVPRQLVELLVAARLPVLVMAQGGTAPCPWPVGSTLTVPFRMGQAEFTRHMEVLLASRPEDRLWGREVSLWKDVRLWSGGNPGETAALISVKLAVGSADSHPSSLLHRIAEHSRVTSRRLHALVTQQRRLGEARQRNTLIIALFAMILRVPLDWSDKFNVKELRELDPEIAALLQTDCLQTFYHPTDGTIAVRSIPTAVSLAQHLALMSPSLLASVARGWEALFETVVNAMAGSKQLCAEAKRRFARFYLHAKLIWRRQQPGPEGSSSPPLVWSGRSELGDEVTVKVSRPRVIVFAGQVPSQYHFMSGPMLLGLKADSSNPAEALLTPDPAIDPLVMTTTTAGGADAPYDSVVFLPGRTAYPFFDAFVLLPAERRLYALSSAPVVGSWLKELGLRVPPAQLQAHKEEGLLTPLLVLEAWREALRKAGLPKITAKLCLMRPTDMMLAVGSTLNDPADPLASCAVPQTASQANGEETLACQFEKAVSLAVVPDSDGLIG